MPKPPVKKAAGSRPRILLVDDHPAFRKRLARFIEKEPDLQLSGSVGTALEALAQVAATRPDLVVVGFTLQDKNARHLIRAIRKTHKRARLLVVSTHDQMAVADQVLRLGADGYVLNEEGPQEILHAIRDVLNGLIYVSEEILSGPAETSPSQRKNSPLNQARRERLTGSEREILHLLGLGKTNREIGLRMRLKPRQVNAHCLGLKSKLSLPNQNALIRYAVCWVEKGEC